MAYGIPQNLPMGPNGPAFTPEKNAGIYSGASGAGKSAIIRAMREMYGDIIMLEYGSEKNPGVYSDFDDLRKASFEDHSIDFPSWHPSSGKLKAARGHFHSPDKAEQLGVYTFTEEQAQYMQEQGYDVQDGDHIHTKELKEEEHNDFAIIDQELITKAYTEFFTNIVNLPEGKLIMVEFAASRKKEGSPYVDMAYEIFTDIVQGLDESLQEAIFNRICVNVVMDTDLASKMKYLEMRNAYANKDTKKNGHEGRPAEIIDIFYHNDSEDSWNPMMRDKGIETVTINNNVTESDWERYCAMGLANVEAVVEMRRKLQTQVGLERIFGKPQMLTVPNFAGAKVNV